MKAVSSVPTAIKRIGIGSGFLGIYYLFGPAFLVFLKIAHTIYNNDNDYEDYNFMVVLTILKI
jgi:hypothetical protein